MTIFSISLSLWFVFIAALIATAALIIQGFALRKKEATSPAFALIFFAFTIGFLILALFSGISRKEPSSLLPSGQDFLSSLIQHVEARCVDDECIKCRASTSLSRDWDENVCRSLAQILKELKNIEKTDPSFILLMEQFSLFREEIVRKIENLFEAQGQGKENNQELKDQIALLIVWDDLLFNKCSNY